MDALEVVVRIVPGTPASIPTIRPRSCATASPDANSRWRGGGMPSSQKALLDAEELLRIEPDSGTTNIGNVSSAHWKRWPGADNRCLVPFTSFSEYDIIDGKNVPVWFSAKKNDR